MEPLDGGLIVDGEYRRDDWGLPDLPRNPGSPRGALSGARDGVLSGDANHTASATNGTSFARDESTGDGGDGSSSSGAQDSEDGRAHVDWAQRFPAFKRAVEAAISELGGRVVPKLNWSCPTDALWVSATNSLACRNADEVGGWHVCFYQAADRSRCGLGLGRNVVRVARVWYRRGWVLGARRCRTGLAGKAILVARGQGVWDVARNV